MQMVLHVVRELDASMIFALWARYAFHILCHVQGRG